MYTKALSSRPSRALTSCNFSACPQAFSSARILVSLAEALDESWAAAQGAASRTSKNKLLLINSRFGIRQEAAASKAAPTSRVYRSSDGISAEPRTGSRLSNGEESAEPTVAPATGLLSSPVGGERSDGVGDRTAGPAGWQRCRRNRGPLLQRSQQRRVVNPDAERDEPVLRAHRFQHPLLMKRQDFYRQGLEVAKHPEQIQPLRERRFQIARAQRCEDSQNTGREFFNPHGARVSRFF